MHELLGGARVARQDDVLLDEVDLEIELVDRHPVLEIAIEAVGLLDQQHADGRMAFRNATISPKPARPVCFAVSTSTYSCATAKPCAAAYP